MLLLALLACAPRDGVAKDGPRPDSDSAPPLERPSQCGEPAENLSYTEVPGLIDTTDTVGTPMEQGAAAMADLDGDGDDDLLIAQRDVGVWLQENEGGTLAVGELLLTEPLVAILALGDVDGDRDLDVFVGGHGDTPTLLLNDGAAGFSPVEAGLPSVQNTIRGASFGDSDGDGDLDLMLAVAGEGPDMRDRLLKNDGSGSFSEDRSALPPPDDGPGLSWDPLWSDLDRDGDIDLYLVNAEQAQNGASRLLINDGTGSFTDLPLSCGCRITGNPMGASVADFNGDLAPDLYITGTGANWLIERQSSGDYVDAAAALGAQALAGDEHMAFGSIAFDHDNDGFIDLLMAAGKLGMGPDEQRDVLLAGGPNGFTDRAPALGLDDPGVGRATVAGLLDADGFYDPLVTHMGGPSRLWQGPCTENRALIVDLVGQGANTFGVGAWLELDTASGTQLRELSAHAGWASQVHPRAHFGLGDETPERLRVFWPYGEVQEVELGADTPLRIAVEQD